MVDSNHRPKVSSRQVLVHSHLVRDHSRLVPDTRIRVSDSNRQVDRVHSHQHYMPDEMTFHVPGLRRMDQLIIVSHDIRVDDSNPWSSLRSFTSAKS